MKKKWVGVETFIQEDKEAIEKAVTNINLRIFKAI